MASSPPVIEVSQRKILAGSGTVIFLNKLKRKRSLLSGFERSPDTSYGWKKPIFSEKRKITFEPRERFTNRYPITIHLRLSIFVLQKLLSWKLEQRGKRKYQQFANLIRNSFQLGAIDSESHACHARAQPSIAFVTKRTVQKKWENKAIDKRYWNDTVIFADHLCMYSYT